MSWKYAHGLVGIRLRVGRRRRADPVGAGRDRVPAELDRLASPCSDVQPITTGTRPATCVDRVLGDEPPLVGRLREPLARRAVDEDAVHPLADVPLEQRAVRLGVELPSAVNGRGAGGPVARASRRRLCSCSASSGRGSWMCAAGVAVDGVRGGNRVAARSPSTRPAAGPSAGSSVKPVVAISV